MGLGDDAAEEEAEAVTSCLALACGVYSIEGFGEIEYVFSLFGVRYYFGTTKSLKDRHRQDDPESDLIDNFGLNDRQPPEEPEENNMVMEEECSGWGCG